MKKAKSFPILFVLVTSLVYSCGNMPKSLSPTPTPFATNPVTMFTTLPTFALSTPLYASTPLTKPYYTPTPSTTSTPTATLDYAALGIPSPTPTPTFDYKKLSSYYLTPFTPYPTLTGLPMLTPTANIPNMLSNVLIRKISPQPPPIKEINYEAGIQDDDEWMPAYIQAITDLMNYVDGNQELYIQYIEAWVPTALNFSSDDWFLEDDYDNDGQIEWLVSIPVRFAPDEVDRCGFYLSPFGYCPRLVFIFEKIGGMYYPKYIFRNMYYEARVTLVVDLNNDNLKEIVFRADPCGAAVCSTYLSIGNWNGQNWEWHGHISNDHAEVEFVDIDSNGTIEIKVAYPTYAASRYNPPYSRRDVIDIYGWKNNRYEIIDQIYPPTDSVFEIIFDIASVLEYKNAELALEYAQPVMDNLDESCDRMKTYVGIQTMLAYAFKDDSVAMESSLAKLEKYCDHPRNAYLHAAKILWLAYEKTNDPISACQAMEQFLMSEYSRENSRWTETLFVDHIPTHWPSCPEK